MPHRWAREPTWRSAAVRWPWYCRSQSSTRLRPRRRRPAADHGGDPEHQLRQPLPGRSAVPSNSAPWRAYWAADARPSTPVLYQQIAGVRAPTSSAVSSSWDHASAPKRRRRPRRVQRDFESIHRQRRAPTPVFFTLASAPVAANNAAPTAASSARLRRRHDQRLRVVGKPRSDQWNAGTATDGDHCSDVVQLILLRSNAFSSAVNTPSSVGAIRLSNSVRVTRTPSCIRAVPRSVRLSSPSTAAPWRCGIPRAAW